MIKNYFKTAWRNLVKNKMFFAINVFGLSAGILFAMLAGIFIWSEYRVNASVSHKESICMIRSKWKNPDMGYDFATLAPLAPALKANYPNLVKNYYHHDGITSIISVGEKHFSEGLQVGDASLLSMFGFPLLYGDAKSALTTPNGIAITANKAKKYFGKTDVLGKTLTLQSFSGSKADFTITAVLKDPPYNTVTSWGNGINNGTNEIFLGDKSLKFFGRDAGFEAWQNAFIISYVQLQDGIDPSRLNEPVKHLLKLNSTPDIQKNLEIYFTPLEDYYLQSNNGIAFRMIYSLAIVSAFILLMAIINFINISVGNSVTRLREIGVRKVMGGSRKQLIFQFLTESILITAFSVLAAFVLYIFVRPFFSEILGKELPALNELPLYFLFLPFILTLLVGTLAGLYPAFILSKQRSVESLKGKLDTVKEKITFRYSLVTIQFVSGIVVFICALVVGEQVKYFFKTDLGFKKDRVITARVPRDWTPKGVTRMSAIRDEFANMREVQNASFSFEIPDGASASNNVNMFRQSQDSTQGIITESMYTDEKYLDTYNIPLVAGKFFNARGGVIDNAGIVINESAARGLGWQNESLAVGQKIMLQGSRQPFTVEGVVKDFHFGSFHEKIRPLFFIHVQNSLLYRYLSFNLKPGNTSATIAALQKKWSVLLPDAPFDYNFIDDTLSKLYSTEIQVRKASRAATAVALIIVLLGVLGIVTQSISKRSKEVGIRKVLGASVMQVIAIFAKEFSKIIFISNVMAWPVAYIVAGKWLNNYAYRISIGFAPFLLVSLTLVLLVSLLIISRTFRIAIANPVNSLRTD